MLFLIISGRTETSSKEDCVLISAKELEAFNVRLRSTLEEPESALAAALVASVGLAFAEAFHELLALMLALLLALLAAILPDASAFCK